MSRCLLKKLLIGGTILLSAAANAIGEQKPAQPLIKKTEIQSILEHRDPFVPPKKLQYYLTLETRIQNSLDGLARRLEKDGFDKKKIQAFYDDKRFKIHPEISDYFIFNPEQKAVTYEEYRKKLDLDAKIKAGPDFVKDYANDLFGAEKKHGIEAYTIAAILGVESTYGRNLGDYQAFNAAVSLYSSKMKEFAYTQLKALIHLGEERKIDIMDIRSSYAVCAFPGQFMIENIPKLFIGKNGDFKGDLFSMVDWIYSVAYYLQKAGWNPEQNNQTCVKGTANWKVIWAYNHSDYYVRAIVELASAIRNNPEVKLLKERNEEVKKLGWMFDIW